MNILITGASGNVGSSILKYLYPNDSNIFIASRNSKKMESKGKYLDIEKPGSYDKTLIETDVLFLLRPPHIADVETYFRPLIESCKITRVKHIIFLSVQGAEKVSFIPHAKIEKLILQSGIAYTFVRPSYFMQNLTTTLKRDIIENNRIFLPAGKTPFLWVDVNDIGRAVSTILQDPVAHERKAYTITGPQLIGFDEVCKMLSRYLETEIKYISPNLLRFYIEERKRKTPNGYIFVMILLHYLPRFQKLPEISNDYKKLTHLDPNTLESFIKNHVNEW